MSTQVAPLSAEDESSIGYPGWKVAAAAFVGVMTSFSTIVPYTFSLFLNPLMYLEMGKRMAEKGYSLAG